MTARTPQPGDILLTRGTGIVPTLIRAITRSPVNHAGIVTGHTGELGLFYAVEALSQGVVTRVRSLDRPNGDRVLIIRPTQSIAVRRRVAKAALNDADRIPRYLYSWVDLLAAGALQYGIRPKLVRDIVARQDRRICSQEVDQAFLEAGVHLFTDGRLPQDVTPGDLLWLALTNGWAVWEWRL